MRIRLGGRRAAIVTLVAAVVAVGILVPWAIRASSSEPVITGLADDSVINVAALREVSVTADGVDGLEILIDGTPAAVRRDGDRLLLDNPDLPDGTHTLTARLPQKLPLLPDNEESRSFTVDKTPPALTVDVPPVTDLRKPFTVRGKAEGATEITVGGQAVQPDPAGAFSVTLPMGPSTIDVTARDQAGNNTKQQAAVVAKHPGMRAVHMSALAWTSAALREPVLRMADERRIDTVQLDIKDEGGEVGYASQVPLAREIGATRNHYDPKAVVDQLHAKGIRVVGRLVAFRDPILAQASWTSGKTNRVIQTADGKPWSGTYGQYAFTNFADPEVVAYNIALAAEAASLGFDDILYDYIRRPEGPLTAMRMPGLTVPVEQSIATFLAQSRDAVRAKGAFLGASVFGIAASRPLPVGQDIPAMAKNADYIAPMVYPSHWGPGEYQVADPEGQPLEITARSVAAFTALTRDTNAQVFPWLQAFSMRKAYGPGEVRAQITGASQAGASSFLLWNAACRYEHAGLEPAR